MPPRPAATVVALRDSDQGSEVLLVQRAKRDGSAGIWVFPGGKVESEDGVIDEAHPAQALGAARRAGVRETEEEAGFRLEASALGLIARWITPPVARKRFDTWFFATHVERTVEVTVDGGEICDHRWMRPERILEARLAGGLDLAPPTFVTIHWLAEYQNVRAAMDGLVRESVPKIEPNICRIENGACILYPGDAGYEASDMHLPGGRNRLWSVEGTLRYERS